MNNGVVGLDQVLPSIMMYDVSCNNCIHEIWFQ